MQDNVVARRTPFDSDDVVARILCFPGVLHSRAADVKCVLESILCSVIETRHVQQDDASKYLVVLFATKEDALRALDTFGKHPQLDALKMQILNKDDIESAFFQQFFKKNGNAVPYADAPEVMKRQFA